MKKFNYKLEIEISRNSTLKNLGVLIVREPNPIF